MFYCAFLIDFDFKNPLGTFMSKLPWDVLVCDDLDDGDDRLSDEKESSRIS